MTARWRSWLDLAATLLTIAVAGVILWGRFRSAPQTSSQASSIPQVPIAVSNLNRLGLESAPLAMVVFSDFQCPFCGRFARETLPWLETSYVEKGKLQIFFHHLPLESIHPLAFGAAKASQCAARAGEFWSFHDALFAVGQSLAEEGLKDTAARVGLDKVSFSACLGGPEVADEVHAMSKRSLDLGITSTPTLLIGAPAGVDTVRVLRRMNGVPLQSAMASLLDEMLKER